MYSFPKAFGNTPIKLIPHTSNMPTPLVGARAIMFFLPIFSQLLAMQASFTNYGHI